MCTVGVERIKINKASVVELYVLEGAQGLPSVDPLTSILLLYIKLSKVNNIKVINVHWAVSARLPVLVVDKQTVRHPLVIRRSIEEYLVPIIDVHDDEQQSKIWAYRTLCSNLEPVSILNRWGTEESKTYSTKLYSKGINFPLKFLFTRNLRRQMTEQVENMCGIDSLDVKITQINKEAVACLNDFSVLLNDRSFMFGKNPCSADVCLVSYLAPALVLKHPDNRLHNLIMADENLAPYIKRFMDKYAFDNEEVCVVETDRASPLLLFAAGVCTMSIMFGYAYLHGIIKV